MNDRALIAFQKNHCTLTHGPLGPYVYTCGGSTPLPHHGRLVHFNQFLSNFVKNPGTEDPTEAEQSVGDLEPSVVLGCCTSTRARKPNVKVSGSEWESL
jgi:NaMN:DMB phosphoribosyltransferase